MPILSHNSRETKCVGFSIYIYIYIDYVSFKFKQFNIILISTLNNNLLTVHNLNLAMLKIDFIWQKNKQILQI